MQRHHWKRASFVVIRGLLLVLIATILQWRDYLTRFESDLYDQRVRYCQQFRPPPTPTLVQMDVDENAISYIGRWPWDRTKLARIIDEIALAKPKIVAMDILFGEPTKIAYGPNDSKGVDADAELAAALSRLGCAVVPVSMKVDDFTPPSKLRQHMMPLLVENPEATEAECIVELKSKGISAQPDEGSNDSYLQIREQAFYERIWREVKSYKIAPPDKEKIKLSMLSHQDARSTGSVLDHLFDEQYQRVMTEGAIVRFTLPDREGLPPLITPNSGIAPILPLARVAAYSGFVDYVPEGIEGTVRRVPLLVRYRDRLIPQMDLVTACAVLGADIQKMKLTRDTLSVPVPGKQDLEIPVNVQEIPTVGSLGAFMEIPLFGRRNDWLTMYDPPRYEMQAQHVNVYEVWRICETVDKMLANEAKMQGYCLTAMELMDPTSVKQYQLSPPAGEKLANLVDETLKNLSDYISGLAEDTQPDADTKDRLERARNAKSILTKFAEDRKSGKLQQQLDTFRGELREKLHDKAIFFGGTATGLLDLQPTSLFHQCPGIVIHGAVYNAIITGKMWRVTSPQLGIILTALIGLITLLIVISFSPAAGFAGSLSLALGYLAFNGVYLFAHNNLIVVAAGPLVAIAMVWSGMTLTSFLTEIAERSRIIRRFQNYVDPNLVAYMVDHPDHVRFDGETREVTCCFSDLAGFTTLTDQMGPGIVKLLSEYMGEMIPVIRKYNGYVSQMAGDGIYFFFGAPVDNPQHALDAIHVTFGMYAALDKFNVTLKERGLSQLGMRIGITTGDVIVGDTGPSDSCAYTGMGPTVNLASRLEGANKVFGSRMLMTARTVELLDGKYLVRPIANLRVAGKLNCEIVYEPICLMTEATERDRQLVECTARVFEAYRKADFNGCLQVAAEMEQAFGSSRLLKLYTDLSNDHIAGTAEALHCDGEISLSEK